MSFPAEVVFAASPQLCWCCTSSTSCNGMMTWPHPYTTHLWLSATSLPSWGPSWPIPGLENSSVWLKFHRFDIKHLIFLKISFCCAEQHGAYDLVGVCLPKKHKVYCGGVFLAFLLQNYHLPVHCLCHWPGGDGGQCNPWHHRFRQRWDAKQHDLSCVGLILHWI